MWPTGVFAPRQPAQMTAATEISRTRRVDGPAVGLRRFILAARWRRLSRHFCSSRRLRRTGCPGRRRHLRGTTSPSPTPSPPSPAFSFRRRARRGGLRFDRFGFVPLAFFSFLRQLVPGTCGGVGRWLADCRLLRFLAHGVLAWERRLLRGGGFDLLLDLGLSRRGPSLSRLALAHPLIAPAPSFLRLKLRRREKSIIHFEQLQVAGANPRSRLDEFLAQRFGAPNQSHRPMALPLCPAVSAKVAGGGD